MEIKTRGRPKSRTYRHSPYHGEQIMAATTAQPESPTVLVTLIHTSSCLEPAELSGSQVASGAQRDKFSK